MVLLGCGIVFSVSWANARLVDSDKCAHLDGSATSGSVTVQGRGGTQACTAGVKGLVLMSFSISSTCGSREQ